MQMSTGEELPICGVGAWTGGKVRGGGGGMTSESALGGGDSDGVIALRIEDVEEESSSSRNAETRGLFEVGGQISSSLSESNVMQSTILSDDLFKCKNKYYCLEGRSQFHLKFMIQTQVIKFCQSKLKCEISLKFPTQNT